MNKKVIVLKYNKNEKAPKILLKGEKNFAKKILQKAKECGILIYEDKNKVDILWDNVEEGEIIPEDLWEILVEIYRYVVEFNKSFLNEVFYESKNQSK
jgi:flagellar biosynthesis protein